MGAGARTTTFEGMKKLLDRLPPWLRNRYGLAVGVLVVWLAFFHNYDLYTTWKLRRQLHQLHEQRAWYEAEIGNTREQLHELTSDKQLLEKFARERYLMKRDNEDIFVLVPNEE